MTHSERATRLASLFEELLETSPAQPVTPTEGVHLVKVADAAKRLSVCHNQIRAMVQNGMLEGVRIGRFIHVTSASIDAFIAQNRVKASA